MKRCLKMKHCWFCHKDTDALSCCGHKTQPNSWIKRFPRYSDEDLAAMKAARKPNQDAWVKRPQQMGLASPK
jgi:hypothetical protein